MLPNCYDISEPNNFYWTVNYRAPAQEGVGAVIFGFIIADQQSPACLLRYRLPTAEEFAEQQQRETLKAESLEETINEMEKEKGDRAYWSLADKARMFPWSDGLPSADEITEETAVALAIDAIVSHFGVEPGWFDGRPAAVSFKIDDPACRYYAISFMPYDDDEAYYYAHIASDGEILQVSGGTGGNG